MKVTFNSFVNVSPATLQRIDIYVDILYLPLNGNFYHYKLLIIIAIEILMFFASFHEVTSLES